MKYYSVFLTATCSTNEEFEENIYRCDNTCETYGRTFDCGDTYKPNGACYCKNDFARLTKGGDCVTITDPQCAQKLPPKRGYSMDCLVVKARS